jgi:hypothetical protein
LFDKYYLSDFVNHFRENLVTEIDKLEITENDLIKMKDYLKARFTIEPLALKEPVPSEPRETKRERKDDFNRTYMQKVYEIDVTIPFDGNIQLFDCRPSTAILVYFEDNLRINSNSVSVTIVLDDLEPIKYQSQIQKVVHNLSVNIPRINAEIAPWNNGLDNHIKQLLEQRRGDVSKKFDFMDKIGLKVNPKSNDFMTPSPVARKTIPTPVSETTKDVKKDVIPILQEEVYKDIKEVLYNVGKAIERKPSIYLKKHEEDLRDVFLLFLETRYDSTTGVGEAFNKKGKTDILLKYAKDGTNLFVAECKFWKGQKKLHEAIDQLLGYLTHRDSKTALIIFVNQKEFISVVATLKIEIKGHPQFKRHIKDNYESSIGYEFILPDDSQKTIQMEVILFHFPDL